MTTNASRPNILFCIADDASHFGCYGHRFVRTPHTDRVAREGVRFNSMFTTNPKCAPSRASIVTGMHTWQLEEACNHWNVFPGADKFTVYTDLLMAGGYHVGHTGKGWGPGDFRRRGRMHNPAGPQYMGRRLTPPEGSCISPCDYAGNFADFLAARPAGAPFCFWYGGYEPHRPYTRGEGLCDGKSPDTIERVPPYWPDDDTVRNDMLDYAFEIEWFDRHVGLMLEQLEACGELDNTLVIVTSDNGCPFPRVKGQMFDDDFRLPFVAMWRGRIVPGRVADDLCSFIDLAPTFLELAGLAIHPQMAGRSLTDVLFAQGSGMSAPDRCRAFMGRERHDVGREGDAGYPVRCIRTPEWLYVRNFAPERWPAGNPVTGFTDCDSSPTKSRVIELHERGDDRCYTLCFGKRPADELYDIRRDPHCIENLAGVPAHAALKEQLWRELETKLRETGDPRIFGKGDIFDTYEYVGDSPHSWAHYLAGDWQPQSY